jgi:hypothetical protein
MMKTTPEGSKGHQKTLHRGGAQEDARSGQPVGPMCQPPLRTSVLHRLKDCIYAIYVGGPY